MKRYKYPRTLHLPYSKSINSDDKVNKKYLEDFEGKEIVITIKMDGENMTVYEDMFHSRSITANKKEYQSLMYSLIAPFQQELGNKRVCLEYMYAKHSIEYDNLDSFLQVFSIWEEEKCLSWKETEQFCKKYNQTLVPVLYKGIFDEIKIKECIKQAEKQGQEGIVIRNAESFMYEEFQQNVIKYVRENHLKTKGDWHRTIEFNKVR